MAGTTTVDQSVTPADQDVRYSYPYRLGRAKALVESLVDPPEWADDRTMAQAVESARAFLAEEAERHERSRRRGPTVSTKDSGQ